MWIEARLLGKINKIYPELVSDMIHIGVGKRGRQVKPYIDSTTLTSVSGVGRAGVLGGRATVCVSVF